MMTLSEAALVLGVQADVLRRQVHLGKLKARKVGPIWTVTEREVERYSEENQSMTRCKARHPMHPKQVRCEEPKGHEGRHGHSFFARYWEQEVADPTCPKRDWHHLGQTCEACGGIG